MQHPRPWRMAKDTLRKSVDVIDEPVIVDADGEEVLGSSEWLRLDPDDLDLIIKAVNAY